MRRHRWPRNGCCTLILIFCWKFIAPGTSFLVLTRSGLRSSLEARAIPSLSMFDTSSSSMTTKESTSDEVLSLMSRSLASDYLIRITCDHSSSLENDNIQWELYPLSRLDTNAAMHALNTSDVDVESDGNDSPVCTLSCCWSHEQDYELWPIDIIVKVEQMDEKKKDGIVTRELLCVLARIMIQSASSEIVRRSIDDGRRGVSGRTPLFVTLPLIEGEGCQKFHLSDFIISGYDCGVRRLFASMEQDPTTTLCYSEMELVDMVNQHGNVLGSLPRPFIHTYIYFIVALV